MVGVGTAATVTPRWCATAARQDLGAHQHLGAPVSVARVTRMRQGQQAWSTTASAAHGQRCTVARQSRSQEGATGASFPSIGVVRRVLILMATTINYGEARTTARCVAELRRCLGSGIPRAGRDFSLIQMHGRVCEVEAKLNGSFSSGEVVGFSRNGSGTVPSTRQRRSMAPGLSLPSSPSVGHVPQRGEAR